MVATDKQNWMTLVALCIMQMGSGSDVEGRLRGSTKTHVDTYVSDTRASMTASLQLIARIVYAIIDEIAVSSNTSTIKSRLQSNVVTKAAIASGSGGLGSNQVADLLAKHAEVIFEAKKILESATSILDERLYEKLTEDLSSINFRVKDMITKIIPPTGDSDVVDLAKAWNTIIQTRTENMYHPESGWTDDVFSNGNGIEAFVIFTFLSFHPTLEALIEDRHDKEWVQVDSIIGDRSFAKLAMPCATSRISDFITSGNGTFDPVARGIHRTAIPWINHQRGSCDRTCRSIEVAEITREMTTIGMNALPLGAPPTPTLASSYVPDPAQQVIPAATVASVKEADDKPGRKRFLGSIRFGKKK